jgi:TolA-binding protein
MNPVHREARVDFAEALFRTGDTTEARARLEWFAEAASGDAQAPRAFLHLAEINKASGQHRPALAAYDRVDREYPRAPRPAKSLLEAAIEQGDPEVAGEASYRLAAILHGEGRHVRAVEV